MSEANIGADDRPKDAETAPLTHPEYYQYDFDLGRDHRGVATRQRRRRAGCSTSPPPPSPPTRSSTASRAYVSDSGEGRWTIHAAIDEGVPAPVLSAALYDRFASRGRADTANKVLSAMRAQFGGHVEGTGHDRMSVGMQPPADALVLFGATGDLAKRKLFPRCTTSSGTAR